MHSFDIDFGAANSSVGANINLCFLLQLDNGGGGRRINSARTASCSQSIGIIALGRLVGVSCNISFIGRLQLRTLAHMHDSVVLLLNPGDGRAHAHAAYGVAMSRSISNRSNLRLERYILGTQLFALAYIDLGIAITVKVDASASTAKDAYGRCHALTLKSAVRRSRDAGSFTNFIAACVHLSGAFATQPRGGSATDVGVDARAAGGAQEGGAAAVGVTVVYPINISIDVEILGCHSSQIT